MNISDMDASLGHDHTVGWPPFGSVSPDACDRKHLLVRKRKPGARLGAFLTLSFGEFRHKDQAAALLKAGFPEPAVELVGARVVDGLGLQRLAVLAVHHERKAPRHGTQLTARDNQARVARIDITACIADIGDSRAE